MSEPAPGQSLDQYEIIDIVAQSGMATIFRARDVDTGLPVALKVPHLQYAGDIVFHQRFLREEQIGLRLDHPGIIKVFHPRKKSRLYLVMEFVEGELLGTRLQREHRLPIPIAVNFAAQISDVLVYLHDHDVIHRDLKPNNVMVLPTGGIKLMDFGIALDTSLRKITWSGLSQSMGTPDYMAPEQIRGRRGDARTDIYSLGVILYEMLAGQVPFTGDNVYAALRSKMIDTPVSLRVLRQDIPAELEETVFHAMERNISDRFGSARDLREELLHPDTVVLTQRAVRRSPVPRLSLWWWKFRAFLHAM